MSESQKWQGNSDIRVKAVRICVAVGASAGTSSISTWNFSRSDETESFRRLYALSSKQVCGHGKWFRLFQTCQEGDWASLTHYGRVQLHSHYKQRKNILRLNPVDIRLRRGQNQRSPPLQTVVKLTDISNELQGKSFQWISHLDRLVRTARKW